MDISKTFFGFTDNMKPMQKQKTENLLNALIRDNGKVMSEKEWVYNKVMNGYTPELEKDCSHYSRRTGEMSKPKDEYYLTNNSVRLSNKINKTLYTYAIYLIENGFTAQEKASKFIADEELKTAQLQAKQERQEAEENAKREQEKHERQAKKEAQDKAIEDTISALTFDELKKIKSIIDYIMSVYSNIVSESDSTYIESWVKTTIAKDKLYHEAAISSIKYYRELVAENSKDPNSSNESYLQRHHMLHDVREQFFGITLDMSPQMMRKLLTGEMSKEEAIKRISQTEKAKQRQSDKLVTFYRYIVGQGYIQAKGEKMDIQGFTIYGMEYQGNYILIEESSGTQLAKGKNKTEAKENASKAINRHGIDKVKTLIDQQVSSIGLSPILQKEVV